MAQLMPRSLGPPSAPPEARVSQLLPNVTCSTCGIPVPLNELGDHTCRPPQPAAATARPASPQQPPRAPPAQRAISPRAQSPLVAGPPPARRRPSPGPSPLSTMQRSPQSPPKPPPAMPITSPSPARVTPAPTRGPFEQHPFSQSAKPAVQAQSRPPPQPQPRAIPPTTPALPPIDTKIGGEAGMAGVGRRGFAAAATAAMFISGPHSRGHPPLNPGMNGRPPNGLSHPDMRGRPPPAPNNPIRYNQPSPQHGFSPLQALSPTVSSPAPTLAMPQPRPIPQPVVTPPTSAKLPFFERYKQGKPGATSPTSPKADAELPLPPRRATDSLAISDSSELAYASRDDDEDEEGSLPPPSRARAGSGSAGERELDRGPGSSAIPINRTRRPTVSDTDKIEFPSTSPQSSLSSSSQHKHEDGPRQNGQASVSSYSHTSGRSRSMSRPGAHPSFEKDSRPPSPPAASVQRHPTMPNASSPPAQHPTRSKTSPSIATSSQQPTARRRPERERKCVKCRKRIEDGKWIRIDGGSGVLCEKDWKMMYLPKCRRCDKPIEGQAIGSSDGQIKGKYHRSCFNCDTCQKPFPDKSFYVFDGKPFCAYHYHEANNSLCASPRCGEPIEGPCAVDHSGCRFHPDHFTCEHPAGCRERLDDYWEMDGLRLCEKHALEREAEAAEEAEADDSLGDLPDAKRGSGRDARALKRTTRYLDLPAALI